MVILGLVVQILGLLAVLVGATWLAGPWALIVGGLFLLLLPEIAGRT